MEVARIQSRQEQYGWTFNGIQAGERLRELEQSINKLETTLRVGLPFRKRVPVNYEISHPFRKDGELLERVKGYFGENSPPVVGPFSKCYWEEINLASESQIKEYLLSIGWKPTEYNYNTETGERASPKLTEDSYESIPAGIGSLVTERLVLKHRYGLLAGLIENVRSDGRIPARANTLGTPTGRFTHSVVVNIPKAKDHIFFGRELRELFTSSDKCRLIGCDAKGLENRMLCHYLNDADMSKIILHGDFHTTVWNQILEFCDSRDNAKNIEYALFYGAGDDKLGRMADKKPFGLSNRSVGEAIRKSILSGLPALERLTTGVKRASKRGYLFGLDGRKLYIRSDHSALNTLLQSGGAITMKKALVILENKIRSENIKAEFVGNFHDEFQLDCDENDIDKCIQVCYSSIIEAGESFHLKVPMEGDVKVGSNWAETH